MSHFYNCVRMAEKSKASQQIARLKRNLEELETYWKFLQLRKCTWTCSRRQSIWTVIIHAVVCLDAFGRWGEFMRKFCICIGQSPSWKQLFLISMPWNARNKSELSKFVLCEQHMLYCTWECLYLSLSVKCREASFENLHSANDLLTFGFAWWELLLNCCISSPSPFTPFCTNIHFDTDCCLITLFHTEFHALTFSILNPKWSVHFLFPPQVRPNHQVERQSTHPFWSLDSQKQQTKQKTNCTKRLLHCPKKFTRQSRVFCLCSRCH